MDIEPLEDLALSDDRAPALATLVAGSEEHDYRHAIELQHRGALAEVDALLAAWSQRHGDTLLRQRVARRQRLYHASRDLAAHADPLTAELGVSLRHQPDVEHAAARYPSQLDPAFYDEAKLVAMALSRGRNLDEITPAGYPQLLRHDLDATKRRQLLERLITPPAGLVPLVAADLGERSSRGFGSLPIHDRLTAADLHALAERVPALAVDPRWIAAMLRRARPADHVDWHDDLDARTTYLDALWKLVAPLPPTYAALKALVLHHRLAIDVRRETWDEARLRAYLSLPRSGPSASRAVAARFTSLQPPALDPIFPAATDLPAVGDDEALVRAYVHALLAGGDSDALADVVDPSWLTRQRAEVRLLAGDPDPRWATLYGADATATLRDRVDLELVPSNPTRWRRDQPVVLEVAVKRVSTLRVRVFRIDTAAYFHARGGDVDVTIDLDGLAAGWEESRDLDAPPMRRQRLRLPLAACDRPGTYVVELIGAGRASRAVIRRGELRCASRPAAAGIAVDVVDELGRACPHARLWMGGKTYAAGASGAIALPFSTRPGWTAVLLEDGDVATASQVELRGEGYALAASWLLDRQALVPGEDAVAIARVDLTCGGAPISTAVLEEPYVEIVTTDRRGTTARHRQAIAPADDRDVELRFPVPPHLASLALALGGRVRVVSEQRTVELRHDAAIDVGTIHGGQATAAFHLRPGPDGYHLALLGKSGEPRAGRQVSLRLFHRAVTWPIELALATDAHGLIGLGALTGVHAIHVQAGDVEQQLDLGPLVPIVPGTFVARAGTDVVVPLPTERTPAPPAPGAWALRALRGGVPAADADRHVTAEAGRLILRGLPPGLYELQAHQGRFVVWIVPETTPDARGWLALGHGLYELSASRTTSAAVTPTADAVEITVADATPRTRVHVVATPLAPAPAWDPRLTGTVRAPLQRHGRLTPAAYVSGRDIGDEYRYVLDRQRAPRRAGVLLDRPSLLLNPWALRTTETAVAAAAVGGAWAQPAPAPSMRAAGAPMMESMGRGGGGRDPAFAAYDFLAAPPIVLANLVPDAAGRITIPIAELGGAAQVHVVVVDPSATTHHRLAVPAPALAVRDLRLAAPLPLDQHVREDRRLAPLPAGATIELVDRQTSRVELVDTVDKLYRALCALSGDATLAAWDFLPRWASLPLAERQALYSKHACHELSLFIYAKDRPFFERVLRPYLASKLHRTFVDDWLLEADLGRYLAPARLDRLNALELALLARRRPDVAAALQRRLADAVELIAPDPAGDDRLVDTFIAGGALGGDATADAFADVAEAPAEMMRAAPKMDMASGGPGGGGAPRPQRAKAKKEASRGMRAAEVADEDDGAMMERAEAAPLYRSADKTQEWAEHNWWHQRADAVGPDLIPVARLWRDLARHTGGPFLSPHVADAAGSFAAAMSALAFVELPFTAAPHAVRARGAGASLTAGSHAIAAVVELATVPGPPAEQVLVGQRYFRADDRWTWDGPEHVEKYVTGELLAAVVYGCHVVVTNPTSRTQRVAVLHQIPAGAIAVGGAIATATARLELEPYQSETFEYAFYFPHPIDADHHGAEVTRSSGAEPLLLAAVPPRRLAVVATAREVDATSWPQLAQRGSLDEVCAFLATRNLGRVDLDAIAWRARDRDAFVRITDTLAARGRFHDTIWAYALRHRDARRLGEWLAARGPALGDLGPALATALVTFEPVEHARYQHLEYAPLVNARAHQLGDKRRILNDGLAAQWRAFLEQVAHRPQPRGEDWLAAAHYLFAMDRPDDAARALARAAAAPDLGATAALQADYLHAYAAVVAGDLAAARARIADHVAHPVDRWRTRFAALAALVDEASGAAPAPVTDPDHRERTLSAAAAAAPTLAARVEGDTLVIDHDGLTAADLRVYRMDLELLFSRQPFFGGDTTRFGFIEPGLVQPIPLPARGPTRVPLPPALRQSSAVLELVAGAVRASVTHFAHELAVAVTAPYGRLQVRHATTGAPRVAAYVKCYARQRGGAVAFYKDGYTDLCGRFDYATLSTDDLDRVERFALLVVDDAAGATVLEAAPPTR